MRRIPLESKDKEKEVQLLSFLKRTKEGEYAQVEESSIPYSRLIEETLASGCVEEEFYYGVA